MLVLFPQWTSAGELDEMGYSELMARQPALDGSGETVAMVEAMLSTDPPTYQPNPASTGLTTELFKYYDDDNPYPGVNDGYDSAKYSWHANAVVQAYCDTSTGVVKNPASVEVFEANSFINSVVGNGTAINSSVVNQSFIFTLSEQLPQTTSDAINSVYDNYTLNHDILFVSGVANNSATPASAESYNGLHVGVLTATSSNQLTVDGRLKPEIISPGDRTSYATPYASGSAALLMQAAKLNHGGEGTSADAQQTVVVKTLLVNGAVKPDGWSRLAGESLARKWGAGMLDVNRSHLQLQGGQQAASVAELITAGSAPVPAPEVGVRGASLVGWNYATLSNDRVLGIRGDAVHHYYFTLPDVASANYQLTSSISWNRLANDTGINNLDFYLYERSSGNVVASSTSSVDNLEHIYQRDLPAGDYVLTVTKLANDRESVSQDYALAYAFEEQPVAPSDFLAAMLSDREISLSWMDVSSNETGYRILRSTSSSSGFTELTTVAADVVSYIDSSASPDTTYYYKLASVIGRAASDDLQANATTMKELDYWRLVNFGDSQPAGNSADEADYDGDGWSNLLEFALGSDPLAGSDFPAGNFSLAMEEIDSSEYLTLSISRAALRTGISYQVEVSDNLEDWNSGEAYTVGLEDSETLLKVRLAETLGTVDKRFLRLKVAVD